MFWSWVTTWPFDILFICLNSSPTNRACDASSLEVTILMYWQLKPTVLLSVTPEDPCLYDPCPSHSKCQSDDSGNYNCTCDTGFISQDQRCLGMSALKLMLLYKLWRAQFSTKDAVVGLLLCLCSSFPFPSPSLRSLSVSVHLSVSFSLLSLCLSGFLCLPGVLLVCLFVCLCLPVCLPPPPASPRPPPLSPCLLGYM